MNQYGNQVIVQTPMYIYIYSLMEITELHPVQRLTCNQRRSTDIKDIKGTNSVAVASAIHTSHNLPAIFPQPGLPCMAHIFVLLSCATTKWFSDPASSDLDLGPWDFGKRSPRAGPHPEPS